jgi:hypothetical protein
MVLIVASVAVIVRREARRREQPEELLEATEPARVPVTSNT